ncbi:MAG: flagellar biosynthesis protein FlhF [Treponema sp.]|nr:flagellar biosynthesis protein FlhF [Treponema sp.]
MSGNQFQTPPLEIMGKNLDDCKRKLFEQYGTDYDLVDFRPKLSGGFLGFFQKEMICAKYVLKTRSQEEKENFSQAKNEILRNTGIQKDNLEQASYIKNQIDDMKMSLEYKIDSIAKTTPVGDKHPTIERIEDMLSANEFTFSYIHSISSRVKDEFALSELDDFKAVQRKVVDWIGESIKIAPKPVYVKLPHVTVLVGPTGVGQTTTVAKIAANKIIEARNKGLPQPKIRLITIDCFKIGAETQLRTFGEIMNIPVDKAENVDDIKKIYDDYKNSIDELIIDTSGYSPNDYENIGKMRAILDVPGITPDVYLAVTASTKASDLMKIIQNYEPFNFASVILTKCDETSVFGNVISVLAEKHKPVSYITDGQKVPNFFEKAGVIYFLKRLVDFEVDRGHIEDMFIGMEE